MVKEMNINTKLIVGMLAVVLALTAFQSYQLSLISASGVNTKTANAIVSESSNDVSNTNELQQIINEITPKGTPDYGAKAGVSYDNVEAGLRTLTGYATISLSPEEQSTYDKIASVPGTSCGYCCGSTTLDQNCGCSHNIALQGLTKWLIQNTDYSEEQILQEIKNWRILFFPQPALQEELQNRNIDPNAVGLPTMVGGC